MDSDQPFLLSPDPREWLPHGHLAWFVIDAVERAAERVRSPHRRERDRSFLHGLHLDSACALAFYE